MNNNQLSIIGPYMESPFETKSINDENLLFSISKLRHDTDPEFSSEGLPFGSQQFKEVSLEDSYSKLTGDKSRKLKNLQLNSMPARGQFSDIGTSSPSRMLKSYLEGSMSLIQILPVSSSAPSSRDQMVASLESVPPNETPCPNGKTLSKYCHFRPTSSVEDSMLVSSSQNYINMIDSEAKNLSLLQQAVTTVLGEHIERTDLKLTQIETEVISLNNIPSFPVNELKISKTIKLHSPERVSFSFEETSFERMSSSTSDSIYKPTGKRKRGRPSRKSQKIKSFKSSKQSGSFRSSVCRSKNGCWTCRLRRKKCPEEKPSCGECVRLGLQCDNSEQERPDYMNDKRMAKKKMDEIKEITNLKKKLRMANRVPGRSSKSSS